MCTIDKYWGVKCYQIEPINGITDPFKFTVKHKDYKYSHELIQDDETFDSSLVNIGLIGLIRMRCSSFSFDVNLYAYGVPMIWKLYKSLTLPLYKSCIKKIIPFLRLKINKEASQILVILYIFYNIWGHYNRLNGPIRGGASILNFQYFINNITFRGFHCYLVALFIAHYATGNWTKCLTNREDGVCCVVI
jgi:hypothetical protein